jgi:hypothetical protein
MTALRLQDIRTLAELAWLPEERRLPLAVTCRWLILATSTLVDHGDGTSQGSFH